eukprot:7041275-Prymnesium_polylepis.1
MPKKRLLFSCLLSAWFARVAFASSWVRAARPRRHQPRPRHHHPKPRPTRPRRDPSRRSSGDRPSRSSTQRPKAASGA